MSYTPKNLNIFIAAYAGAIAGMAATDCILTATTGYGGLASVASAFAQSYDTAWGTVASTQLDNECTKQICQATWQHRNPPAVAPFLTPATYTAECNAIIALVQQGDTTFGTLGAGTSSLGGSPIHLRAAAPAAAASSPYVNQTPLPLILPDNAKACQSVGTGAISSAFGNAYARVSTGGAGTLGELASTNTQTPAAGQWAVTPTGDLLFNQVDAFTSVDVGYLPDNYNIVDANFVVTPGTGVVAGLPANMIFCLRADSLAGGVVSPMIVGFPNTTAPAAGNFRLDLGKLGAFFAIADAITSCHLVLAVGRP